MNARAYSQSLGLFSDSKTTLLRDRISKRIAFIGDPAFNLKEKVPSQLDLISLVEKGRIADPSLSALIEHMMTSDMDSLLSKLLPSTAIVLISRLDTVHRKALSQAFHRAGSRKVILIPYAAGLAASTQEEFEDDFLVVDLGAGKMEFTALAGGHCLFSSIQRFGGGDLDEYIRNYVEFAHDFVISMADARMLKESFSFSDKKMKKIYLLGKDLKHGKITTLTFSLEELKDTILQFIIPMVERLESVAYGLPAGQLKSLKQKGILLSGGMSQMEGIDDWISSKLQLPVKRVARQYIAPLLGAAKLYSNWDKYSYLESDDYSEDL